MKTKYYVWIFGILLAVCLVLSFFLLRPGLGMPYAEIWSDGELVTTVDLAVPGEWRIESENGMNLIRVDGGMIVVAYADCPDGYCERRGYCNSGADIVCLPNRLVIHFVGSWAFDGISG